MTEPVPFVELRLQGQRFDAAGVPVEALSEVVAYRELLVAVAKEVFIASRPGRQRVARGFVDRLQLRLREVREGSSVPVLERLDLDEGILKIDDEFDRARSLIEEAISAVARNERLPADFPTTALPYFNRFGQTLQAGEGIELAEPGSPGRAVYTPAVRKRMLLSHAAVYRSQVSLLGRIAELDAEQSTFRLRTADHGQVSCRFEPELFATVRDALQADGEGPLMRVDGVAVRDRYDVIQRLENVNDVSSADDQDDLESADNVPHDSLHRFGQQSGMRAVNRLRELAALKDGWLDGEGNKVHPRVLALALQVLDDLGTEPAQRRQLDYLRIFPTVGGGLQFEFSVGAIERSVELRPDLTARFAEVDVSSERDDEQEFATGEFARSLRLIFGVPA